MTDIAKLKVDLDAKRAAWLAAAATTATAAWFAAEEADARNAYYDARDAYDAADDAALAAQPKGQNDD